MSHVVCPPRWLGPSCRQSHLEDDRGFLVVVQDGVGVGPPSPRRLELVADLDGDVGEAVLLTKLWVGRMEGSEVGVKKEI